MSKPVSPAEYARIRGVSKTAVAKAIRAGRISTTVGPKGQKLIDVDQANIDWAAKTDIARQRQGAPQEFAKTQPLARESADRQAGDESTANGYERRATARTPSSPTSISKPGVMTSTLLEEKTRSERLRIERQEMDLAERRGELVSRTKVRAAYALKLIAARDLLMSIPDRIAGLIAAEQNPEAIHRLLSTEILTAMLAASEDRSTTPH